MLFCSQPFNKIEIYENGDVFTCCPPFINNFSIGNIFNTPFDEIWNGKKVQGLRLKLMNSDFSLCADICNRKNKEEFCEKKTSKLVEKYPTEVSISSDNTCNVRCKICRDENFNTEYNKNCLDKEIETIWMPILKNAKILRFGCSGEPFASYKEKKIIQKASTTYPNLKFHFHTNGILANEKMLKDLGVYDRIDTMTVSIHSATRWTYNKIIRGGKYDKMMSNLKLYAKMKKESLLNKYRMIFVVYDENYKEMPKFVKLAQKLGATAEFWALRENNVTELGREYNKHSIISPNHKKHKDLIKILNSKVFNSENIILYPELENIKQWKQNK